MFDIIELKTKIEPLAKKYDLSLVVLFGSQATGKTHRESDTDIGFLSRRPIDIGMIAEMQLAFTEALKDSHLELVDFKGASPLFLKHALLKAKLLHESEPSLFARFKIYALKLYFEAQPLYRIREQSLQRYLQAV